MKRNLKIISLLTFLFVAPQMSKAANYYLELKLFIEGYYYSSGTMYNCLYLTGQSSDPIAADSVEVSLMDSVGNSEVQKVKPIINIYGNVVVTFTNLTNGAHYYLRIKHRNSVETWSSGTISWTTCCYNVAYDFTDAANKAYADNQATFGSQYAIFSGDINQDGAVDGLDWLLLDPDIQIGNGGYIDTDISGDGAVDGLDYLIFDPNNNNGVGVARP